MNWNFYRFRSVWRVDATAAEAFTALSALTDYPAWWPQVRSATAVAPGTCELTVRSLLPYDLVVLVYQERRDPVGGVLEATLSGDLDGYAQWTFYPGGTWARLIFEEEVLVNKALLRRLAVVTRPALRANHALMMHQGERGLRAYLAGLRAGRRPERP
jgi:hypothetical protein